MKARAALLASFAVAACGGGKAAVELRLYPCALPGGAPMSVTLEIQSFDQQGAAIGALLVKTFEISEPAVFSDEYATVDFAPPAGTVTADFAVKWSGGGAEATASYAGVVVPPLGEAIVLGADACDGGTGSTGEPTTGTTDPTTGTSTTEATTGTGTTDATTGTGTTDATTGTDTTDATTGTTGDMTTGTDTGTTGDPEEGQPCGSNGDLVCDGGPGVLGQFLLCSEGLWKTVSPPCDVETVCPPELGLAQPQLVGCLGEAMNWTCACADTPVMECAMDGTSKCGEIPGGFKVDLCVLEDGKKNHYAGKCNDCVELVPGEPLCVQ